MILNCRRGETPSLPWLDSERRQNYNLDGFMTSNLRNDMSFLHLRSGLAIVAATVADFPAVADPPLVKSAAT